MTEKMIRDAYARIRTIDQTIPDDVLDFMKDASIEKLKQVNNNIVLANVIKSVCQCEKADLSMEDNYCGKCGLDVKG